MEWKIFSTVLATVFIAELGDKTQLATMLFAADSEVSKVTVFVAASLALILASALGVLAGSLLSEFINEKYLHYIAGAGNKPSKFLRIVKISHFSSDFPPVLRWFDGNQLNA